jgi:hypothetical protein
VPQLGQNFLPKVGAPQLGALRRRLLPLGTHALVLLEEQVVGDLGADVLGAHRGLLLLGDRGALLAQPAPTAAALAEEGLHLLDGGA